MRLVSILVSLLLLQSTAMMPSLCEQNSTGLTAQSRLILGVALVFAVIPVVKLYSLLTLLTGSIFIPALLLLLVLTLGNVSAIIGVGIIDAMYYCIRVMYTQTTPLIKECPLSVISQNILRRSQACTGQSNSSTGQTQRPNILGKRGSHGGNDGDDNGQPSRKRGRKPKYHSKCSDCSLWIQSGGDQQVRHLHPTQEMRHPGPEAHNLACYASTAGIQFHLEPDSCICVSCYKDFTRNASNKENRLPRWYRVQQEFYHSQQQHSYHCMFCCESPQTDCECKNVHEWGPQHWHEYDDLKTWRKFLSFNGYVSKAVPEQCSHLCKSHYRRVREIIAERKCSVCAVPYSSMAWKLVCDSGHSAEEICTTFALPADSVGYFNWICYSCRLYLIDTQTFTRSILENHTSPDPITAQRSKQITDALQKLTQEGICYASEEASKFKDFLASCDNVLSVDISKMVSAFGRYLERVLLRQNFYSYSPASKRYGRIYYNDKIFNPLSIPYIYNLYQEKRIAEAELSQVKATVFTPSKVRAMIQNQTSLFPVSGKFDYRSLVTEDGSIDEPLLESYYDKDLFEFMKLITRSDHSKTHTLSPYYKDCQKKRLHMAISILTFTMNPQSCFLQTLMGLFCYTYGLRDAGFDVLNAMGCTCSIDTIRKHGAHWAKQRHPLQELNLKGFWRITVDNLNFKMKFAKKLGEGISGAKKQLDLITGQVADRPLPCTKVSANTLLSTVITAMEKEMNFCLRESRSLPLTETCFNFQSQTSESIYFDHFQRTCFTVAVKRMGSPALEFDHTFMESVQTYMPHWTPSRRDRIVYTTIDEASSASKHDIELYLIKLKDELKIGQEGYPSKVVIAGDQQTFVIMKSLKSVYPSRFNWMFIMHGDWHLLNLLSQVLRTLLWDGGLKQFAFKCGHKKELTQWQDVHLLLMATHEVLMNTAVTEFSSQLQANGSAISLSHGKPFWEWIGILQSEANLDQVSRFWAGTLQYLNYYVGYYLSIRSGNWYLRNTCLKAVTPIFFAFSRDKYEQLCTNVIMDVHNLPDDLVKLFATEGEWTTSLKGIPFRNLALDEAHESVINRRLKQITSRPSHFRTVELSNFMAYMDKVVEAFERFLFREKVNTSVYKKRFVCQRVSKITEISSGKKLFSYSTEHRPLTNVFHTSPSVLDSATVHDLLNFFSAGTERMHDYVKKYLLAPLSETPKKRHRLQKMRTFTKAKESREQKSKIKHISNIATNAIKLLQAHGIMSQTSEYPLAIANIDGTLRKANKAQFRDAMCKVNMFTEAFTSHCKIVSDCPPDLCLIIDFLYFIHIPPPPDVTCYSMYFEYLWERAIVNLGIKRGFSHIYIVIDKPEFLPPPRALVHRSRAKKAGRVDDQPYTIADNQPIPHSGYISLLSSSKTFKSDLIRYISFKLTSTCVLTSKERPISFLIDSPSAPSPFFITQGTFQQHPSNQHGESDYAVWHHAVHSPCTKIVIFSGDTDTWVYGLGIMELEWLQGKTVFVQRSTSGEYVDINNFVHSIKCHSNLQAVHFPACTLVAIYVLTGGDYTSSFYGCSKDKFIQTFMNNITYILQHPLVEIEDGLFSGINKRAWLLLVTSVYYTKHLNYFQNKTVSYTYEMLTKFPDADESKRLLSMVKYDKSIQTIDEWCEFIRLVTFHASSVTQKHEAKVLPTQSALLLHLQRANYVLKLAFSSPQSSSDINSFTQYGWKFDGSNVEIEWGPTGISTTITRSCTCSTGCSGRCSCFKNCSPCTAKCKCKQCKNPHNSGYCDKCTPDDSSSDESECEAEQTDLTLEYDSGDDCH